MALGKQIKHYREKLGWKLEQLSFLSGVEVGTISALENRDSARSKFGPPIAKAFGLTMEQLLDESSSHEAGSRSASLAVGALPIDQIVKELAIKIAGIEPASRSGLVPFLTALTIGPDSQDTIEAIKNYLESAPAKKRRAPDVNTSKS